ncbi:ATP-binding cassette domain-containing protein [Daejeonella sp. H1SJ63]|jgi:ABC-type multidrug transport system ATPase subunit|uniref:ATP-binding cassette domain-containing protein n=1 Tax=Daejeonella sp. H1SJ63 TaxID=3034145 RepID=UPI0023EC1B62|nr:ATP-binding cassette domain-containing protein [Daejeonella sp. H1SJ63]
MKHLLEVDSVSLNFSGRVILSDIYLKAETGKIVGLLGRNGQGKSCLMKIISGTLKAESKSVRFDGKTVFKLTGRSDLLVYLPQFNFIPSFLTLLRVFKDFCLKISEFETYFPEFISKSKLKISEFSGGERRLIELYVIIKSKSQFALLDEPFTHISPMQIERIKKLLIQEKENKGFIVSDHMFRDITEIADRIYILNDRKLHLTNSVTDLEKFGYARF